MKQCAKCKKTKPRSEFNKSSKNKTGLNSYCQVCSRLGLKQWSKENPSRHLLYRYGITLEEKGKMVQAQNNYCLICKNPFKNSKDIHVDHCHETDKIRGVLCHSCNTGIGHFRDSPKLLQRAIHYIEHHAKQKPTTPVSEGTHSQSDLNTKHGASTLPGFGENDDHTDDYSRTVRGQDADHRAQEGSGDGMGCRGEEVGTFVTSYDIQNHGEPNAEIVRLEFGGRYLLD
jgi:Recombination endonuclease VII